MLRPFVIHASFPASHLFERHPSPARASTGGLGHQAVSGEEDGTQPGGRVGMPEGLRPLLDERSGHGWPAGRVDDEHVPCTQRRKLGPGAAKTHAVRRGVRPSGEALQ